MRSQDKAEEWRFFDAYAGDAAYDVLLPRAYRRLLTEAQAARGGRGGWQADLGCGTGAFTRHLLSPLWRTAALDLSRESLRRLPDPPPAVFPLEGDIEALPFGDDTLDFAVLSGVLHHLPDPRRTLAEVRRVLRPGARGFSYDPNEANPAMWLFRSPRSPVSSRRGRTVNERNLTRGELGSALRAAGFVNVRVKPVSGMLFRRVSGFGGLLISLYNLGELLLEVSRLERAIGSFLVATFEKP